MRLHLDVWDPDGRERTAVVVETEASATVGVLAAELAGVIGAPGAEGGSAEGVGPSLYRGPTPLDAAATLQRAGIRDGVELGVGAACPAGDPIEGSTELRVVSGVGAGTAYRLSTGEYDIGSGEGCRVRLTSTSPGSSAWARVRLRLDGVVELVACRDAVLDDTFVDRLRDDESAAALGDAGSPGGGRTPPSVERPVEWRPGAQLSIDGRLLEIAAPGGARAPLSVAEDGLGLEFNRPPRFRPELGTTTFRLPQPPVKPDKRPFPLLPILLLPAASALVSIVVTGRWAFVFLALLSPLAALANQFSGRKQALVKYERDKARHEDQLFRLRADIDAAVLSERRALCTALPDPAALLLMAVAPSERLWERRWRDQDFLSFRAGTADLSSSVVVEDPTQDEHRRRSSPQLQQAPIGVDVRRAGVVGVAGPRAGELAAWAVAQAVTLQSPADLRVVVLAGKDGERHWSWTRWLPHTQARGEDAYVLVGSTTESWARRVGELGKVVAERTAAGTELRRGGSEGQPDLLVVLPDARRARSMPGVVPLLRDGPAVGVFVLCLETEERLLPEECGAVVVTDDGSPSRSRVQSGGETVGEVRTDLPDHAWFEELGRALAALRGVGDQDESSLPASCRLLDVLGLEPPTADALAAGWSLGGRSTTALLGAGYDGPFGVDLVRDGPHALIAGTTGSGKSELLQTLVATLAVVNRPDEMTFVLIDYKGGSAFAECNNLPHTVGLVTDLDARLVERALVSLGAELRRRETLLAAAGAKDLIDYLDKRSRRGDVDPALPRLLLVIDEFASMVRELPDFVAGLVNIAQRGRSLGIHLVLATQRPGGAITPDIRANTNLRVALRTTDASESRDIIDAPDSGSIPTSTPGRAFARLGPSVLLPFQAARVGGRRRGGDPQSDHVTGARASVVTWAGLGGPLPVGGASASPGPAPEDAAVTDLAVLVSAVADAAEGLQIQRQPSPWLPPLPDVLEWRRPPGPAPLPERGPGSTAVALGLVDLPAQQARAALTFDLDADDHLQLIGSPRSGRSQALRTLAAGLTVAHGADDLHLYGLDCGNGALHALAALPHCGAVVEGRQTERVGRLLDRLGTELASRQALLGARGTADLGELRRAQDPGQRTPHIVVLVDRFEVFDREFGAFDNGSCVERMVRLLRDGPGVGIHVVMAGDRTLTGSRYSGTTDNKLVLNLNDRQDYAAAGVPTRSAPTDPPPGRAIRVADLVDVQIAVLGADLGGVAQAERLQELAAELTARDAAVTPERRAFRVDLLPDRISFADAVGLETGTPGSRPGPMRPLVAVGGDTLAPIRPDLGDIASFVVAGPPRSGRSTALVNAARSLLDAGSGLVLIAPRRSPLRSLEGSPGVTALITDPEIGLADFRSVLGRVPQATAVVVIDDAELVMGSEIDPDLAQIARGAQGDAWALLVGGNSESLGFSLSGWVGQAKRNRCGMLLSPQSLGDGDVIGVHLSRGQVGQAPQPGRGLLHLGDGRLTTVQVPLLEPSG